MSGVYNAWPSNRITILSVSLLVLLITSLKIISKILEIEIEIAEESKETRVASIPTCELL